jgi:hypothetical protein
LNGRGRANFESVQESQPVGSFLVREYAAQMGLIVTYYVGRPFNEKVIKAIVCRFLHASWLRGKAPDTVIPTISNEVSLLDWKEFR